MRFVLHTFVVLVVIGLLAGVGYHYADQKHDAANRALARRELATFQQQINLQTALDPSAQARVAPASVDPAWFKERRPSNPLLGPNHPWVEIATESQRQLAHPPGLTADDQSVAAFWYNPAKGIVRARVPAGISDAAVLALYNEINDTSLTSVFVGE